MKYKCRHAIQLNGAIVHRDDVVELDEATYKAHLHNFEPIGTKAIDEEVREEFIEGKKQSTKRDIIMKLEQLGVPYKARDTFEELQARLVEATSPRKVEV